jgi:transcriptional regulator with XRE-family HTH domain
MTKEKDYSLLGKRIKKVREASRMSKLALANLVGVSDDTISRWENGEREPTASALFILADIFCVTPDYLMGQIEDTSENPTSPEKTSLSDQFTVKFKTSLGETELTFPLDVPEERIKQIISTVLGGRIPGSQLLLTPAVGGDIADTQSTDRRI